MENKIETDKRVIESEREKEKLGSAKQKQKKIKK